MSVLRNQFVPLVVHNIGFAFYGHRSVPNVFHSEVECFLGVAWWREIKLGGRSGPLQMKKLQPLLPITGSALRSSADQKLFTPAPWHSRLSSAPAAREQSGLRAWKLPLI